MNSVKPKGPVWDKANSTYMRIIYLENGYTLTGYSKKFLQSERRDKIDLLTNWILRDFKNGYLDKATLNPKITPVNRVEYFIKQQNEYYSVINLYYEGPDWINPKWLDQKKFYAFITKFYAMVRRNLAVSEIVNALEVRSRASSKDPFDISIPRFPNKPDLDAYMQRLLNDPNMEREAIENFYRKYNEKYFKRPH